MIIMNKIKALVDWARRPGDTIIDGSKKPEKKPEPPKEEIDVGKITDRQLQRLLAKANYYKGGIDGDAGPITWAAIDKINAKNKIKVGNSKSRRRIAAAQLVLNAMGYEAGVVDGYAGHNTLEALEEWEEVEARGKKREVERKPTKEYKPPNYKSIPLQRNMRSYYGTPGKGGTVEKQLVRVILPYPMRLAWALNKTVKTTMVHKKAADSLVAALTEVKEHYGMKRVKALGLDLFGGVYNPRRIRGGKSWSTHAYGCAIDIDPARNRLKWRCPKAQFCKPEYKAFLDIMEKHGWLPALRLWGKDAMHFQCARLR